MNELLNFRIKLAIARGRNIIYYRERDTRERCQYIHVVREYRKLLVELSRQFTEEIDIGIRELFQQLIQIIDPKVKSEGCIQTVLDMKQIFLNHGIKID